MSLTFLFIFQAVKRAQKRRENRASHRPRRLTNQKLHQMWNTPLKVSQQQKYRNPKNLPHSLGLLFRKTSRLLRRIEKGLANCRRQATWVAVRHFRQADENRQVLDSHRMDQRRGRISRHGDEKNWRGEWNEFSLRMGKEENFIQGVLLTFWILSVRERRNRCFHARFLLWGLIWIVACIS